MQVGISKCGLEEPIRLSLFEISGAPPPDVDLVADRVGLVSHWGLAWQTERSARKRAKIFIIIILLWFRKE